MPTESSSKILSRAASSPDLDALRNELTTVRSASGALRQRQRDAEDTRLCRWESQAADCRKHGEGARPFEGAADTRPMIVDSIINERVALLAEALMTGEMQAVPLGVDGAENAAKVSRLLRWLREVRLKPELRHEAALLANYQEGDDPGVGVMKVWWRRIAAMEMRVLTVEDVEGLLVQARGFSIFDAKPVASLETRFSIGSHRSDGEGGAAQPEASPYPAARERPIENRESKIENSQALAVMDAGDMIFNPLREGEALEALGELFPTVKAGVLRRALLELRRVGRTELPLPYPRVDGVAFRALRFMDEVFFPADIDDVQRARVVFERELISEADLRVRAAAENWEAGFVEAVLEKGPGYTDIQAVARNIVFPNITRYALSETSENLYEIWWAYSKTADDYGIEGVYVTLFSARVTDVFGRHELLDYPDGEYPFVLFRHESVMRGAQNSRGIPQIAASAQYQVKIQDDCMADYTQLSTLPPLKVNMRRGGLSTVLGPMTEIPVRNADDVTWMMPPPFPSSSQVTKQTARGALSEYFGRLSADVPPELRTAILQNLVNNWLDNWVVAWGKALMLMQDQMSDVEMSLVSGGPVQKLSRDEIRGSFRTVINYNVNDLNLEFVMKRMQAIAQLVPYDTAGTIDHNMVIRAAFRAIDPALADIALTDAGTATDADAKDEQQALLMMTQGIEPPLRQDGSNAQLRLQVLQRSVQGSPVLARRLQQPQSPDDEFFAKLVQNRVKNLQFLLQQYQENPMIGRTGTKPLA